MRFSSDQIVTDGSKEIFLDVDAANEIFGTFFGHFARCSGCSRNFQ